MAAVVETTALLVRWAASGEVLVALSQKEFEALWSVAPATVRALKLELVARGVGSGRFQFRLWHVDGEVEMEDETILVPPLDLKLVRLPFQLPDEEEDEEFVLACDEGRLEDVKSLLQRRPLALLIR